MSFQFRVLDTNGGLTVAENLQETALYGCDVLYHKF